MGVTAAAPPPPDNTVTLAVVAARAGVHVSTASRALTPGAPGISAATAERIRRLAAELGYQPMAKWLSGADYGCDPKIMGIGPAYAVPIAIKRAGLSLADMDVLECNEAFAVQNLAVVRELEKQTDHKIDMQKWNPNGGAIALGHPLGMSGARLALTAAIELQERGARKALCTMCIGVGQGIAMVIEAV